MNHPHQTLLSVIIISLIYLAPLPRPLAIVIIINIHCLLSCFFRWSEAEPEGDPVSASLSVVVCQTAHNESESHQGPDA